MAAVELNLKWARGGCEDVSPVYLSSDKLCFPCGNFLRICSVNAEVHRSVPLAGRGLSSMASIPRMGILASSEKCDRPIIHVMEYPSMKSVQEIRYGSKSGYRALAFAGMEHLVSVCGNPDNDITVWNWKTGVRLVSALQGCTYDISCKYRLTVDPSTYYQLCLQQNMSLTFLEIISTESSVTIEQRHLITSQRGSKDPFSLNGGKLHRIDKSVASERVSIVCHCWIPNGNLVVACDDDAITLVEVSRLSVKVLNAFDCRNVTGLAYNADGLFVGQADGCILWIDISRHEWRHVKTLSIGQPIESMSFSPDFERLTIVSSRGSVFMYATGSDTVLCVVSGDKTPIVAVAVVLPESKYCATARKSGLIQIWLMATGTFVAKVHVGESVLSMTRSPLCPLLLVSTASGYLYFLDLSDVSNARLVHVTMPYDVPVRRMSFDNIGVHILVASGTENIQMYSGLPSNGFRFLGSYEPAGCVEDIALFLENEKTEANVALLCKTGSCIREGVADVLQTLKLPWDLHKDPEKYQLNVFGTLPGNSLEPQVHNLEKPASLVTIHCTLGAVLCSPLSNELYSVSISGRDTENTKYNIHPWRIELGANAKICDLAVSSDHNYIFTLDRTSKICAYNPWNSSDITVVSSEPDSGKESKSKLDFSAGLYAVIVGSKNGTAACYELTETLSANTPVPTWISKCKEISESEAVSLRDLQGETSNEVKFEKVQREETSGDKKSMTYGWSLEEQVRMELADIHVTAASLALERVSNDGTHTSHTYHLHEDDLNKLCTINEKLYMNIRHCQNHKDAPNQDKKQVMKGIKVQLEVSNYADPGFNELLHRDIERAQEKRGESSVKTQCYKLFQVPVAIPEQSELVTEMAQNLKLIYVTSSGFLYDESELRKTHQKLDQVALMKETTRRLKEEYNLVFRACTEFRRGKVRDVEEKLNILRVVKNDLCELEPYWHDLTADDVFDMVKDSPAFEELNVDSDRTNSDAPATQNCLAELERIPNRPEFMSAKSESKWTDIEKNISRKYNEKVLEIKRRNSKKQYEHLLEDINDSIDSCDRICEALQGLKTICNFMVFEEEMKIYLILLTTTLDRELKTWAAYYNDYAEKLLIVQNQVKSSFSRIKEVRNVTSELYSKVNEAERDMDQEIKKEFEKNRKCEDYKQFRRRLSLNFLSSSSGKNPYLVNNLDEKVLKGFQACLEEQNSRPQGMKTKDWERVRKKLLYKFALEKAVTIQASHVLNLDEFGIRWRILEQDMKSQQDLIQKLMEKLRNTIEACNANAMELLFSKVRNNTMTLVLLHEHPDNREEAAAEDDNVSYVSTSDPMILWRAISTGIKRNKRLDATLERIQDGIYNLAELRSESKKNGKLEGAELYNKRLKELLSEFKQAESTLAKSQAALKDILSSAKERIS